MITVEISDDQLNRAKSLYEFGVLNGSITGGSSSIYGAIGEIVFGDIYENKYLYCGDYNFDFKSIDGSTTVDIKTKRTTATPRSNWRCSVAAFNIKQKCDFYFFIRVSETLKTAYLLGYISKKDFFDTATFFKKGEADPDKPDWKFAGDCYNVYVSDLNTPSLASKVEYRYG